MRQPIAPRLWLRWPIRRGGRAMTPCMAVEDSLIGEHLRGPHPQRISLGRACGYAGRAG